MDQILETLYKERKSLQEKLEKLEALIISYGGSLERNLIGTKEPKAFTDEGPVKTGAAMPNYQLASWKQRIAWAIKELGRPSSVVEITDLLCKMDNSDRAKVHKSVTLYCSSLSIKGEMEVDRTGEVNRYFVKDNSIG